MTVVLLLFHPRLVGLLGLIGTKADPAPRRTGDLCSCVGEAVVVVPGYELYY